MVSAADPYGRNFGFLDRKHTRHPILFKQSACRQGAVEGKVRIRFENIRYRHWGADCIGPGPTCSEDHKPPLKHTVILQNVHMYSTFQSRCCEDFKSDQ
jgi:hypothetical protein